MADRLNGYRVLILETREEAQFSRLLSEQGADVLQCPMFTINDAPDPAPIEAWIRRAIEKPFDDLVLLTGEGLRRLMKVVRRAGAEMLSRLDLKGHRLGLQLYPDKDHGALIGAIKTLGAEVDTVLPYVYDAKAADANIVTAIEEMAQGRI